MLRALTLTALGLLPFAATAQGVVAPAQLRCSGNEPFWRIDVGPENALLDRLAERRERAVYRGKLQRFSHLDPEWVLWRGQSIRQSTHTAALVARREACPDTMADGPPADYRAVISFADGTAATGCCRARFAYDVQQAPIADYSRKSPGDWSRQLPSLAPGLTACVIDSGIAVANVAGAASLDPGRAVVLLRSTDRSLHECTVEVATRKVEGVRAKAGIPPAGSDQPRFLPAREQPPLVTCGRLERALDRNGQLVGYLQYDPCD